MRPWVHRWRSRSAVPQHPSLRSDVVAVPSHRALTYEVTTANLPRSLCSGVVAIDIGVAVTITTTITIASPTIATIRLPTRKCDRTSQAIRFDWEYQRSCCHYRVELSACPALTFWPSSRRHRAPKIQNVCARNYKMCALKKLKKPLAKTAETPAT